MEMASMITPNEQQGYVPLAESMATELGPHTHSSTSLLPSESGASTTPHLDHLGGRAGNRNPAMALTHVLRGFQEEGSLVQTLHEQPHGKLPMGTHAQG